ncbi:MAG: hypothetical protein ACFCVE_03615 [Phycisphaerae bacterium]
MTLLAALALLIQAFIVVRLINDEYRRCWIRQTLRIKAAARARAIMEAEEIGS